VDMVSLKVVTEAQVWLLKAMEMSRCQAALVCLVMLVCQAVLADTVVINTLVVATGLQVQAAIHLALIATMEATKVNRRPSGTFWRHVLYVHIQSLPRVVFFCCGGGEDVPVFQCGQ